MEWLSQTVQEWGSAEFPEGNATLQRGGMLSKAQLEAFYTEGLTLFTQREFIETLKQAHKEQKDIADIITDSQKKIFENQGVQGDFGVRCLSRVTKEYWNDPQALQRFMEFAQREELVMDEAELPDDEFRRKKAVVDKQHEISLRLQQMTAEERQKYLVSQQQAMQRLHEMTDDERQAFLAEWKVAASSIMHEMGGVSRQM